MYVRLKVWEPKPSPQARRNQFQRKRVYASFVASPTVKAERDLGFVEARKFKGDKQTTVTFMSAFNGDSLSLMRNALRDHLEYSDEQLFRFLYSKVGRSFLIQDSTTRTEDDSLEYVAQKGIG